MAKKIHTTRPGRARMRYKKASKMHNLTMGKHRGGRRK